MDVNKFPISNTSYAISASSVPTYFHTDSNRQPKILDILLVKSIPFTCVQVSLAELDSDHTPVKISFKMSLQHYRSNNALIKGKPNWTTFSNLIHKNFKLSNNIYSIQAVEQTGES